MDGNFGFIQDLYIHLKSLTITEQGTTCSSTHLKNPATCKEEARTLLDHLMTDYWWQSWFKASFASVFAMFIITRSPLDVVFVQRKNLSKKQACSVQLFSLQLWSVSPSRDAFRCGSWDEFHGAGLQLPSEICSGWHQGPCGMKKKKKGMKGTVCQLRVSSSYLHLVTNVFSRVCRLAGLKKFKKALEVDRLGVFVTLEIWTHC